MISKPSARKAGLKIIDFSSITRVYRGVVLSKKSKKRCDVFLRKKSKDDPFSAWYLCLLNRLAVTTLNRFTLFRFACSRSPDTKAFRLCHRPFLSHLFKILIGLNRWVLKSANPTATKLCLIGVKLWLLFEKCCSLFDSTWIYDSSVFLCKKTWLAINAQNVIWIAKSKQFRCRHNRLHRWYVHRKQTMGLKRFMPICQFHDL